MTLKQLLKKFGKPKVNGFLEVTGDQSREVIVQVFDGWVRSPFDNNEQVAKYSYHKVKTAGMLFFDGEFKYVIAAYPFDGESDEA